MDLLGDHPPLDLFERNWRIYSVAPNLPPQFVAEQADIKESLISEGCAVYGAVTRSVIFQRVAIGRHSAIKRSVVMHDVSIGEHVEIENAIVSAGNTNSGRISREGGRWRNPADHRGICQKT
jgi:glucose-1-phosphate adenylyltransferase